MVRFKYLGLRLINNQQGRVFKGYMSFRFKKLFLRNCEATQEFYIIFIALILQTQFPTAKRKGGNCFFIKHAKY